MLENGRKIYLEIDNREAKRYVVRQEDEKLVLLEYRPAVSGPSMEETSGRGRATLAEYAEKWLETVKFQVKESTFMKYWNLIYTYIIPELGGMEWDSLNRETVELFCGRLRCAGGQRQSGLSAKTVTDIMSVLRRIFYYASDHGAGMRFNISTITVKKESKEMKVLTGKEQNRLYSYLRDNLSDRNLGILMCMFTGLRLGEICALKWEDISFAEQTISVHRTMQRLQTKDDPKRKTRIIITPPKSGSSVRKIPIPRELIKILYFCRKPRNSYILTGREDSYVEPRTMERHFAKVLDQAGIERVNFHTLRHTFATRCVEMEFDVKSLSEILGHANVNVTLGRYVHPTMELKRRNMQKLSVLLTVSR